MGEESKTQVNKKVKSLPNLTEKHKKPEYVPKRYTYDSERRHELSEREKKTKR